MAFEIPDACTLPTVERPVRLAEFDVLLRSASSVERDTATHVTFSFTDVEGLEDRARDLTARESSCCSFFEFEVGRRDDHVVVGVGVPAQHQGILDSMTSRAGQTA